MSSKMTTITDSVQYLKSIGPKRVKSFENIGIKTIKDLLYFFPTKYLDRTNLLSSAKVLQYVTNGYEGEVTVIGEVLDKEVIRYSKKQILKVRMKDNAGLFDCVWFQGIKYFKNYFKTGEFYALSAKPAVTRYGHLQFVHPDFDKLADKESKAFLHTGKIIPFYKLPKELKSTYIGDLGLRKIINNAVENYADQLTETLPEYLINRNGLLNIVDAIRTVHFPENMDRLKKALERFKFEELFYLELLIALRKSFLKTQLKGYNFKLHSGLIKNFLDRLPFELTRSQLNVLSEIKKDMLSDKPMNRLLQGDVGSGKTVVAIISMLIAVGDGKQTAIMAPTEILANQHFLTIKRMVNNLNIKVGLLIGGQKGSERKQILTGIKNGKINIVVGTHALFEESVEFNDLKLIVIDEQHRFGVIQRAKFIEKGAAPDILVMSATPIPRTLTMTIYGDLDVSVIDKPPSNRKPVKTILRGEKKLPDIYNFIIDKAKEGYQAFIVYPLVSESEKVELKAAETYYSQLKESFLKNLRVGLIHGRMKWDEKEDIMKRFANKEFDVLVSTTVIEVGIDIPDANILVINDAFQFGLSQLHQLRGRVGRSGKQAYCILVTEDRLATKINRFNFNFDYMSRSEIEKHKTLIRLNAMVKYANGFDIAEIDLKLRGPGNIFGLQQSGFPDLKYSDIIKDTSILIKAKEEAFDVVSGDANLSKSENKLIKNILLQNYRDNLKYSHIA